MRVHCLVCIVYVSIETNVSYSVRDVYIVLEYMLSLNYVINCHISEKIKCVSLHVMIYYILFTCSKPLVLNNKNFAVGMLLITFANLKLVGIF